jgi:hypothetical protein
VICTFERNSTVAGGLFEPYAAVWFLDTDRPVLLREWLSVKANRLAQPVQCSLNSTRVVTTRAKNCVRKEGRTDIADLGDAQQ